MSDPSAILVWGELERSTQAHLEEAALASHAALHTLQDSEDAAEWIQRNNPCAILLGNCPSQPPSLALETRAQARHRQIPILALARDPSDLEFAGAFSWGADDVVTQDRPRALTTRLRALSRKTRHSELPARGVAVVGEPDQNRRVAIARVLCNAGFDVQFAVTERDAYAFSLDPSIRLVVASSDLCPEPESLLEAATVAGKNSHFILVASPKRYTELLIRYGSRPNTRVTDFSAPPENIVYLANELSAGSVTDQRKTMRHLYGTTVRFRAEGLEEDELGFSYNVSSGGLYVRTLAPPSETTIWIELVPPRTARRVRLVGEVVWKRPFGPNGYATVPPGFGARIIDGSKADLARWEEGCSQALAPLS